MLAAALALPAAARAQSPPCRFEAAPTTVTFTGYTPFGPGATATTTIHYDCPPPSAGAWIGISAPRVMTAGPDGLQFELYREATHANVWLDAPPVPVTGMMNGSVTVHAFLPAQDAAAGAYTTTLVVRMYSNAIGNQTDSANLVVEANVAHGCIIDPATLAFGTYDPSGTHAATPLDAQGAIRIACTRGTPWAVGLGTGNNPAGATRRMSGPSLLPYELYSDSARTAVWSTTSTVSGTAGSIAPVDLVVYGRIAPGQNVTAGPYQDVVQSTINF